MSTAPPELVGADGAAVAASLKAALAELVDHGPAPGRDWCRAWTDTVDAHLATLAAAAAPQPRFAVAAVGGYGRRELCPASDLDLLLLHDGGSTDELEQLVRRVVYPLWDAGLTVGYAVRDRREAIGAIDDVDTATATMDLRPVVGDVALAQLVRSEAVRRLRRRPHRFVRALADADRARRARAGDAAEVLEPDLKNGAGGLRDVQSLRWAAGPLVGSVGLDPLVPAGYLGASDRPRLARAEDTLLAARVALHLVAGKQEVLRLDLQDAVAAVLGITDRGEHLLAPHLLLEQLYLAARTVDHVHRRAWALIDADVARGRRRRGRPTEQVVDGFELVDGVLRLPADADLDAHDLPVRLLDALVSTGAVLDRGSAARLRTHAERGQVGWGWDDHVRARFCRVLWRGRVALPAIGELDEVGVLTAWLPEWRPLRGRPQRNPYHRFSLDRHAWHAVAELGELVRREPWAAETLGLVEDRESLLLGVLLHDVGKALGEPHAITGVPLAGTLAERMRAAEGTISRIQQLVRQHLLLPDSARKRDVTDPALASELAEQIGDVRMLASLHLLAVADARATGPSAWSPWTAALLGRLVSKVRAVLDASNPDDLDDSAVATARTAQELAAELGADADAVRSHLALLPSRYPAAVSARAVVRHTLMAATRPSATEVRTRVTRSDDDPDGLEGLDQLDVVALDHPGWFAKVAGVVALEGGSIVAADAFARDDGLAVDTFKVRRPDGAGGSWWARVEGDLHDAAAGRLAVRARVVRKARTQAHRLSKLPPVDTAVSTAPDPAGRSTVLEIRTLDRLGVLYTIASALAELHLDIVVARIQTVGHEVIDVFYLRDADGNPLDVHHLDELELAVMAALEHDATIVQA